jgi:hypothetical protein
MNADSPGGLLRRVSLHLGYTPIAKVVENKTTLSLGCCLKSIASTENWGREFGNKNPQR